MRIQLNLVKNKKYGKIFSRKWSWYNFRKSCISSSKHGNYENKDGDNALVAYSLGNYISAETMDVSKIELVLNIEIRTDAENKKQC